MFCYFSNLVAHAHLFLLTFGSFSVENLFYVCLVFCHVVHTVHLWNIFNLFGGRSFLALFTWFACPFCVLLSATSVCALPKLLQVQLISLPWSQSASQYLCSLFTFTSCWTFLCASIWVFSANLILSTCFSLNHL